MSKNPNPPPSKPDDQEKTPIRNDSRFWVATVLIVGMLIILIISVLQSQYTQTTQLAAIFSGWITSIIAFYFYTQTSTQLQNQIRIQAEQESQARARRSALVHDLKGRIMGYETAMKSLAAANRAQAAQDTIDEIKAILEQQES